MGDSLRSPAASAAFFLVPLTGSNFEVAWQSALAITDTTVIILNEIDVFDCSDFNIIVRSTLNQQVSFYLLNINQKGSSSTAG
ncbi:hypothetical protein [Neobacillus sp. FSL H8-0543]|uniref:hypothetical protein n=1 Tax=Neobacillus sp. FSL H8-0543 TaxID=2954672 RepID=UPI0031592043